MESKFTPQPWLEIWGDYDQSVMIKTESGKWVEATESDINLMKSSLDLLGGLKDAIAIINQKELSNSDYASLRILDNIVATAEGRA